MKKNVQMLLFVLLCVCLTCSVLTVGASADFRGDELDPEGSDPYRDKNGYVIWSYNSNTETVRGLGKEYTLYVPTMNIYFNAETVYYFNNKIVHPQAGHVHLCSYNSNPEILESSTYSLDAIYATERGRISLQALEAGNAVSYKVTDGIRYAPLDAETAIGLKDGTEKKTFDVNQLENCHAYDIIGIDGTGAYYCVYGAVYLVDGAYYYVYYLDLGNQYFDAEGDFSYRKGSVEAVMLDEKETTQVQKANDGEYKRYEGIYESDEILSADDKNAAVISFVVGVIFLGFIVPLPLLIVGICMARSIRRRRPTYWYALSVVAGVWMLTALILMIVLL